MPFKCLTLVDNVNKSKHILEDREIEAFTRNVTLQFLPLVLFMTSVSCNFAWINSPVSMLYFPDILCDFLLDRSSQLMENISLRLKNEMSMRCTQSTSSLLLKRTICVFRSNSSGEQQQAGNQLSTYKNTRSRALKCGLSLVTRSFNYSINYSK